MAECGQLARFFLDMELQLLGLQGRMKGWIQSRAGPGTNIKDYWVLQNT